MATSQGLNRCKKTTTLTPFFLFRAPKGSDCDKEDDNWKKKYFSFDLLHYAAMG
jgi:hypothetical protein